MEPTDHCANCGATMQGDYCVACGQRRFRPEDRRFSHLLRETFDALTDLDSRLWRSLRALVLQPGRIARDWTDGRRAYWISPIRLFLLANLLYFLAPVVSDLNLPLYNQVRGDAYRQLLPEWCADPGNAAVCDWPGQFHSPLTEPVFLRKLAGERAAADARGERFDASGFELRYDAQSAAIGKLLVIVHVPFVALMLWLVVRRKPPRYYAEHFVVALGLASFILVLMPMVKPLLWLYVLAHRELGLPGGNVGTLFGYAALAVVLAHFTLACRRSYDSGWVRATVQGLLAFVALGLASIFVYRPLQFLLALWTM